MGDHLIVLHSAVRACAGYDRHEAPSILMDGSSIARDTEHGRTVTAQLTRRQGTLEEAIEAGMFGLNAAGLSKGIRRQARGACEDYFYSRLELTPARPARQKRRLPTSSHFPGAIRTDRHAGARIDERREEGRGAQGRALTRAQRLAALRSARRGRAGKARPRGDRARCRR